MRKIGFLCAMIFFSACFQEKEAEPNTEKEKIMYSLGHRYSFKLRDLAPGPEEIKMFLKGINDGMSGKTHPEVNVEEGIRLAEAMVARNKSSNAKERLEKEKQSVKDFVETNLLSESDSGLYYKIESEGDTESRINEKTKFVRVKYVGKKLDGTVFDKTSDQNLPAFPLKAVLPAWQEALQMIGKGGRILILSPPQLAFGDNGAPPRILGGESVIFEMELVDFYEKAPKKK